MAFLSVFDVIGPNMIGPSSSHTAGAAVLAFLAQKLIAPPLRSVSFTLHGSFAKTYLGHGTDRALLGGVMGFSTDDVRIRNSLAIAEQRGLTYSFLPSEEEKDVHPNTVDIRMKNEAGKVMEVRGESLGGGKVHISRINGVFGRLHRRIQHGDCRPAGYARRGGAHHEGAQRQRCEHRLHATLPRVQRAHGLHHRGIGRPFPRGD